MKIRLNPHKITPNYLSRVLKLIPCLSLQLPGEVIFTDDGPIIRNPYLFVSWEGKVVVSSSPDTTTSEGRAQWVIWPESAIGDTKRSVVVEIMDGSFQP